MKKSTIILTLLVLTLSCLLAWEKLKLKFVEEDYLNSSIKHLAAGASEAIWIRSGEKETYFYLMECTFESFPDVIEASQDLEKNEKLIENTKEVIAHYYTLSGYTPTPTLSEFLGEHLEKEYEPYEGFKNLPNTREGFGEIHEANRLDQ